ncbi:phospholipase D-like domain-containing protein [Acinetobacter equi]|uniref:phospholipase D-like domain-containing protein n=1 Tax=Acinetobacter equi TaxID=1324350 RepID=UPI000AD8FCB5|nr:phospholipase D family protein [Acinetobacter equi]
MVERIKKYINSSEASSSPIDSNYWFHSEQNIDTKIAEGLTAFLPLYEAFLSIATRLHLITKAQHHIDLQYYIWENDELGHLLLSELLRAANRGVQIRLLIDDQNGTQLDSSLEQLVIHPNFSIKFYNPYKFRKLRALDFLYRAFQINRRMHNKLIIADGEIAVTGGRNISRQYFNASNKSEFTDFDILFYGPPVKDANRLFLDFWNDTLSCPVNYFLKSGTAAGLQQLKNKYEQESLVKTIDKEKLFRTEKLLREYHLAKYPLRWAKAHFIGDTPNKTRNKVNKEDLLYNKFIKIMGMPKYHFQLVSAYFIPTKFGVKQLTNIKESHVSVRILTNSYLANNVPIVHAFYQKYRQKLLTSNIKIYELKPFIQQKNKLGMKL